MDEFQFEIKQLAFLVSKYGITYSHLAHIALHYTDLFKAIEDTFSQLDSKKCLAKAKLELIDNRVFEAPFDEFCQLLSDNSIELLSYQDTNYPLEFRELSNPPLILYYQGNLELLSNNYNRITVIGSRNIKPYTNIALPSLITSPISNGLISVSGLALGVDSLVHNISVSLSQPTIGIVGSGLDNASFYPFENLGLKAQILENNGLILSEYAPNTPPNRYNFPHRNRLLAAISPICFVPQASLKSGSLITVTQAQKLGRKIVTIPANITERGYEGNLELLQSNQASLITAKQDIEILFGYEEHTNSSNLPSSQETDQERIKKLSKNPTGLIPKKIQSLPDFNSDIHREVWNILSSQPLNIEKLQEQSGLDLGNLQGILTGLELDGLVAAVGSNDWIRV